MSARIWHILGIKPTNDIKEIKKAYAAKSKEYHPEEHPDAFEQLQTAYKLAIRYAKGEHVQEVILPDVSPESDFKQPVHYEKTVVSNTESAQTQENFDFAEVYAWDDKDVSFWEKVEFIIWHPRIRNSYEHWHYFLNLQDSRLVMKSEESRKQFVELLKKENFTWHPDMLQFFDNYLEAKVPLAKQLRKRGIWRYIPESTDIYETPDEKNVYGVLWWSVEEKLRFFPELYLEFYFSYALSNKERLSQVHKEAHRARCSKVFKPLKKYLLILGFVCLLIFAWIYDQQEEKKESELEKILEEHSAERMEEIFELLEEYNIEPKEK